MRKLSLRQTILMLLTLTGLRLLISLISFYRKEDVSLAAIVSIIIKS